MPILTSLGVQIRAKRQALNPSEVGLPELAKRRQHGLSIMEVAVLSGVGLRWLSRLEQDQLILHDFEGLKRILQTLRFSPKEQHKLLQQAGWLPERLTDLPKKELRRHLQQTVDAISAPAYILDQLWQPVCHNRVAGQLFSHWLGKHAQYQSLIDYLLFDPQSRLFIHQWQAHVPQLLRHFCQQIAPYRNHKTIAEFLQQRRAQSPLFESADKTPNTPKEPVLLPLQATFLSHKGPVIHQRMVFTIPDTPQWQMMVWLPESCTTEMKTE
ncbi:helix-turn-helix domain-containing protein [Snodgrassella sp. CFCC 13594]|uniref:MmyB family transcriptional regulator n=1 Tax=Snodgrassella sp. CFCC 13594 TaxID=1775559 RepID=UPI0009ED5209|nr:helix-turn-helix domain-containing protein [Snodgrassella sp. CFCC 13594]